MNTGHFTALYFQEQELHVPAGGIIYAKLTHHVAVQFSITSKSVKELFEPKVDQLYPLSRKRCIDIFLCVGSSTWGKM